MNQERSGESGPANPLFWKLYEEGRFAEALVVGEQGLHRARQQLGARHPGLGILLNELAATHGQMGNYAQAEKRFLEAIELLREAPGDFRRHYAGSLQNLAALNQMQGDCTRALPLCRRAVEIMRLVVGENDTDYAAVLLGLASLHDQMGDYAQAVPLYRQVVEIRRNKLGPDHPDHATALSDLATLYAKIGASPESYYRQALDIYRRQLGERHPRQLPTLNGLVESYLGTGRLGEAEPLARQAVLLSRLALGKDHPDFAVTLHNLGYLHQERGDLAKAVSLYQQALEIERRAHRDKHPDHAIRLNALGHCYCRMGRLTEAEPLFRQALAISRTTLGEEHPVQARRLGTLAGLCAATGRPEEAFGLLERMAAIDDRLIGQIFSFVSEQHRMAYLARIKDETAEFLSLVLKHLAPSGAAVRSAFTLVLRRKALGAEAHRVQSAALLGGRYPQLKPGLEELAALRTRMAEAQLAGPGPLGAEFHRKRLADWQARKEWLEAEQARQVAEMNLENRLRALDLQTVALALPAGAALVEFVRIPILDFGATLVSGQGQWQPARYLAFVLLAGEGETARLIDLGEAEPIERLIVDFRNAITAEGEQHEERDMVKSRAPRTRVGEEQAGRALRAAVFDPLLPAFEGRQQLLLAPDGDLTRLPFEVLPTNDGRQLIDTWFISYLACGRDLLQFGLPPNRAPGPAVVVADPDFDLRSAALGTASERAVARVRPSRDLEQSGLSFDRLPATRQEGIRIGALLEVRPWLQAEVLKTRLEQVRSPWILHLATHGFFLADQQRDLDEGAWIANRDLGRLAGLHLENPLLRSGLALAGGNTWLQKGDPPLEARDGLLTAEDVTGMDLLDTELVVLSACNTGLGEIHTGEGVFGLRRAFALAGAKTLVMSLWKVPDEETRVLMEDFYLRILAGEPRGEALRNAQLAMKTRGLSSFFWGAFICQGNPGPLLKMSSGEARSES
jgi:CHAT domain-containing protein/tetratricopeptide (TPR) repeat protein